MSEPARRAAPQRPAAAELAAPHPDPDVGPASFRQLLNLIRFGSAEVALANPAGTDDFGRRQPPSPHPPCR